MDWPSNKENLYQNVVKTFVLDKVDQYVRFYSESALKNDLISVSLSNSKATEKNSMQD